MYIQLKGIEKTFDPKLNAASNQVLKGINLSVDKGEMIAIKGASGAGKSTLLHILGCLDRPSKGTYLLENEDISNVSAKRLAEIRNKKIGFVLQHFALIDDDDVLQNVGVPLLFSRSKLSTIDEKVLRQLSLLGIEHLARRKVSKLSGGEKQRVAIARALVNQPDIILADEPTGALDQKNSQIIIDIFQKLNSEGKTIIIVTHEDFVANSCKKIITISDGIITDEKHQI